MAYTKQREDWVSWPDTSTRIRAQDLDGIEEGIQDVHDKVDNLSVFNVVDYGATGDGTTNDSTAIQDAVDAVGANGGVVYFPEGSYNLGSTSIDLTSKIHVRGAGQHATIVKHSGASRGCFKTTETGTTKTVYSDISISDMKLEGVSQCGAALYNTTRARIENVWVSVSGGTNGGVFFTYCDFVLAKGITITAATGNGINVHACDHVAVVGNHVSDTGDDAIDIDCDFLAGAPAIKSKWVTVSGNVVDGVTGGNGIRVENSDYVSVTGNTIYDTSDSGIRVNNTTGFTVADVTVTGNTCINCDTYGITVFRESGASAITGVVVSGNSIDDCGNRVSGISGGIGIILGAERTLVTGNRIRSCGNGAGGDAGGILLYKLTDTAILSNHITDCTNVAINFWNGDEASTYTGIVVGENVLENNTDDFGVTAGAENQTGIIYRNNWSDTTLDIASASTVTLPGHSDFFNITGTTTITSVTASSPGRLVTLLFDDILTFTDGSNLNLAGNLVTAAGDTITLVCDGTNWNETGRSENT